MNKLQLNNYNFQHTLLGGQAFNWDFINGAYYGFTQSRVIKIIEKDNYILWQTYPENDEFGFLTKYLNIDNEYEKKLLHISKKDKYIKVAVEEYKGLRLLNQDFHQTLLSFILSSHKSVKGVRKAVHDLSRSFGNKIEVDGLTISLFPEIEVLSTLAENEFRSLGFGFRAKYFKEALFKIINNELLIINNNDENEVRRQLIDITGIGEKIADCIMTFSLGFQNITPLDIWGKRVLIDFYGIDPKLKYSEMREWYQNYFQEDTALAGQYLFEYIRGKGRGSVGRNSELV